MIQKLQVTIIAALSLFFVVGTPVYAGMPATSSAAGAQKCGDTKTQLIQCEGKTGIAAIGELITIVIGVLTVLIGIVATGGLAYAGIIYASAQDDQSKVGEAKKIIQNVVIGILLYGFTIAIINWLIPGGVINSPEPTPTPTASVSPSPSQTP